MQELTISYSRVVTFNKTIKVTDMLAERLLKLDGETDLLQGNATWNGGEDDTERVDDDVWKADEVSDDNFTALAEDMTCINDVYDMSNEITDICISKHKKS